MNQFRLLTSCLLLISAAGCTDGPRTDDCSGCNVLLVVVDTLRADHLGIYGYARDTSPNIDAFARDSVVFSNARSQASCTYPSVNSILTSRYPEEFIDQPKREGKVDMGIPEEIDSIAEILQRAGYHTVAISGSPIVRDARSFSFHNSIGGYERGFNDFNTIDCKGEHCSWVNKPHAEQINESAVSYLEVLPDLGKPFFLYLHYMDVHDPYTPPGDEYRKFSRLYESSLDWILSGNPNPIADMLAGRSEPVTYSEEDLNHMIGLYDDELAYFDEKFAELLEELDDRGLREDTLIFLVADHGEAFMEHGTNKHCVTLFDNEIKTPMIVHAPEFLATGFRDHPVGNVDVVPTILDYLAIEEDGLDLVGQSLRPIIENEETPERLVYGSQLNFRSLYDGRFKLIFDVDSRETEVYDVLADPLEMGVASEIPMARADFLHEQLLERAVGPEGESSEALENAARIGEETEAHLRAIGYLH